MRPGVTIVTIPGPWYVTTRLTGPADRGAQPGGVWTGLAGVELGIHAGDPVNSSVLEYLVSQFGGFDIIIASDHNSSQPAAQVLTAGRHAVRTEDAVALTQTYGQPTDEVRAAALETATRAALVSMQRSGEPLADDRLSRSTRPTPPNLGREWVIATFRHEIDDETRDPLPHTHNVVLAITERQWSCLRDPSNNSAAKSV